MYSLRERSLKGAKVSAFKVLSAEALIPQRKVCDTLCFDLGPSSKHHDCSYVPIAEIITKKV
jgi:hypothetical protein